MPYIGSKNQLAKHIFAVLPRGERFVELFGGGGAMTHYASVNGLYSKFLYNEINPLVCKLFKDALEGKYSYENFRPQWVTREQFHREKSTNGYIACVWSFGNDFNSYIYANETVKREIFEWIVNDIMPTFDYDGLREYRSQIFPALQKCTLTDIHERRVFLMRFFGKLSLCMQTNNKFKGNFRKHKLADELIHQERLHSISRCQSIEHLDRLGRMKTVGGCIEVTNADYREYAHRDGDVVYCDPPYEIAKDTMSGKDYKSGFNAKQFYDWAATRDYPVYCSGYLIPDDRFVPIFARTKKSLVCSQKRGKIDKIEYVYLKKEFANERQLAFE